MFSQLFNQKPISAAPVAGHWRLVQLCVDQATQEWLNVGIAFYGVDGERGFRLISNLSGIRCLYDADAADSARFALDQAEYALEEAILIPIGWNIALGPEKFVQGVSINAILDGLFSRLVPLGRHQTPDRADSEDHQHATMSVRRTVRLLLNQHLELAKNAVPEFWRRNPTPVQRDGAEIQMDVQIIASERGMYLHGSVASAWYKTKYHRSASLSQAVNAITTACQAHPQSSNVLYLLKPPSGVKALSDADHQAIAQDIESSQWLLEQHNARLEVVQSEQAMARSILRDLRHLPELG